MANGCTVSATATTTKISVTAKATYTGTTYSEYQQDWKITVANVGSKTGTITLPRGGSPRSFSASFNVSAYPDEERVVATLVEGSVALETESEDVVLRPGEQVRGMREADAP